MANYDSSKRPDQLDVITTIDNADIVPVFDASDADFKTKQITWANTVTTIAGATKTLTNTTIDADGTGNSITNLENENIKAGAAIDATKIANGSVSNTEFQYLDGVTSAIQTQIDGKANISHTHNASDITAGTLAHERGGLEADVSAYNGLLKISGGATSQAVANTDFAGATHASRHTTGQADEIDGDELDIDFTPSNYTRTTGTPGASTASLASHLRGIDTALAGSGAGCTVYRSSNQTVSASGTTKIQFNAEEFDIGSNFDSSTNYRFTAPSAGYYLITATVYLTNFSDGTKGNLRIVKNSVLTRLVEAKSFENTTNSTRYITTSVIASLATNDYIEAYIDSDDSSYTIAGTADERETVMSIFKL